MTTELVLVMCVLGLVMTSLLLALIASSLLLEKERQKEMIVSLMVELEDISAELRKEAVKGS